MTITAGLKDRSLIDGNDVVLISLLTFVIYVRFMS